MAWIDVDYYEINKINENTNSYMIKYCNNTDINNYINVFVTFNIPGSDRES